MCAGSIVEPYVASMEDRDSSNLHGLFGMLEERGLGTRVHVEVDKLRNKLHG